MHWNLFDTSSIRVHSETILILPRRDDGFGNVFGSLILSNDFEKSWNEVIVLQHVFRHLSISVSDHIHCIDDFISNIECLYHAIRPKRGEE